MYNKLHTTHIWVMEVKMIYRRFGFLLAEGATHINSPQPKVKLGFTLAEVLITLGIIGVVAALTIPNLMTHLKNKKLESQFKKTYAELNIAARTFYSQEESSVHDADVILYGGDNSEGNRRSDLVLDKFMTYFKGYQKTTDSWWLEYDRTHKITQKNLNSIATEHYPCDESRVAIDIVGRLYAFDNSSTQHNYSSGPKVCVDINGNDKPNQLGYDRFVFVFTENNAVVPYTGTSWNGFTENITDDTEIAKYCNYELGADIPAFSCAYFALKDKSPDGKGTYWRNFLK